ncbi:sugar kinase [Cellulomonas alba]|uniref:Sugar kinase n=1 Tax=Cellulomonas alba TaxID=3053467 RepID=A0ABT7SII6_9CELL|nr:sugar kinase [Cellulomonas alba]MDM7856001.1 sugar kinase [Cellulomonas alba]
MARLLCIGEILVEMVAVDVDQPTTRPGRWAGPFPSGAPAILADQAALCGAEVSLVGTVGRDAFGTACLTRLRASGVVVDQVRVDPDGTTGVAFVSYRGDGSRSFVFHLADAASGRFRLADVESGLLGVDVVHLMGSSVFSAAAAEAVGEVFDAARARGIAVSFDPNLRPETLRREHVPTLLRILRGAQVVLASEGELQLLLGDAPDEDCARQLLAGSATTVVLKRGARGAGLYLDGREELSVPAVPVDEVDPTGAGDCFGGTFLALVLQGWAPADALRHANLAGALAVTQRGPMSGNRTLADLRAAEHLLPST